MVVDFLLASWCSDVPAGRLTLWFSVSVQSRSVVAGFAGLFCVASPAVFLFFQVANSSKNIK